MLDKIKDLRESTGLGMMACKAALEEAGGDVEKAIDILRKKGVIKAAGRSERETKEGTIGVYLHSNNKIATMVKLASETDFVARNEVFQEFARDLAMHVAASNPRYVDPSEVSQADLDKEKEIYMEQLKAEGKKEDMIEKIVEGKLKKYAEEYALMKQAFVKDPSKTIEEMVTDMNNKMGENIHIVSFVRYSIG